MYSMFDWLDFKEIFKWKMEWDFLDSLRRDAEL